MEKMKPGLLYIFKEKEFLSNNYTEQYVFYGNPIEKPDTKIVSHMEYSKYNSINGFKIDTNGKIRIGPYSYYQIFLRIPEDLADINFNCFNRLVIRSNLEDKDKKIIFGDLEK